MAVPAADSTGEAAVVVGAPRTAAVGVQAPAAEDRTAEEEARASAVPVLRAVPAAQAAAEADRITKAIAMRA